MHTTSIISIIIISIIINRTYIYDERVIKEWWSFMVPLSAFNMRVHHKTLFFHCTIAHTVTHTHSGRVIWKGWLKGKSNIPTEEEEEKNNNESQTFSIWKIECNVLWCGVYAFNMLMSIMVASSSERLCLYEYEKSYFIRDDILFLSKNAIWKRFILRIQNTYATVYVVYRTTKRQRNGFQAGWRGERKMANKKWK